MDEPMRQTAHVILDGLVAFDEDLVLADDPAAVDAARLALERLNDTGAVVARVDEATGGVFVDLQPLVGAASVTIFRLVSQLARERGISREDVIAELRTFLDEGPAS